MAIYGSASFREHGELITLDDGETRAGATTNDRGEYRLDDIASGQYDSSGAFRRTHSKSYLALVPRAFTELRRQGPRSRTAISTTSFHLGCLSKRSKAESSESRGWRREDTAWQPGNPTTPFPKAAAARSRFRKARGNGGFDN